MTNVDVSGLAKTYGEVSVLKDIEIRFPGYAGRSPRELSGGPQQRVALARAIVIKPSVLLLDEPLSALDRRLRQEMQVELLRIQREIGLTTIFVTHDQEEALALSDNVAILNHGNIIQEGRPREIYERPRTRFAAQFLGDSNFLSGEATADGLRLGDGTLQTPGAKATIAVRPEKMTIQPLDAAPEPGANRLPAKIDAVIYSGPALTYLLSLADGTEIKLFAQNTDGRIRETGEEVALSWPAEHSVVLSD